MVESTRKAIIANALAVLKGQALCETYRAADMRTFGFGALRQVANGLQPTYTLHIQCAWRLRTEASIVTGSDDFYVPSDKEDRSWRPGTKALSLQDVKCALLVYGEGGKLGQATIEAPTVARVDNDGFGDVTIVFSNGAILEIFPIGSTGEYWRLFEPETTVPHFVASAEYVAYEQ